MKAKRNVASAAVVSLVVLTMAEQYRSQSLPPTRQLIAYAFVFFVLSAFADFDIEAAGAFAILAMVAIILSQGEDALKFATERFGSRKGKTP